MSINLSGLLANVLLPNMAEIDSISVFIEVAISALQFELYHEAKWILLSARLIYSDFGSEFRIHSNLLVSYGSVTNLLGPEGWICCHRQSGNFKPLQDTKYASYLINHFRSILTCAPASIVRKPVFSNYLKQQRILTILTLTTGSSGSRQI